MKNLLVLALFLFAPTLFANTIQLSSPTQSHLVVSLNDLEAMPQTTYITELPWLTKPAEFAGVKLSTVLQHAFGDVPQVVEIRALNDYHANISREDILHYQPIVAYKQNRDYIKIRNKGPYWLIFSVRDYPELNTPEYHSKMVWQINKITVDAE